MRYESKAAHAMLKNQAGLTVEFQPQKRRGEEGQQFGLFDSNGDKAIEDLIENGVAFKGRKPGKKGIWRESERIEAEKKVNFRDAQVSVVRNMTEPQLRAIITSSEVAVPAGASKSQLEEIAARCLTGDLKPGTVPEVAEHAGEPLESAPVAEAEEPKRAKSPKAKK